MFNVLKISSLAVAAMFVAAACGSSENTAPAQNANRNSRSNDVSFQSPGPNSNSGKPIGPNSFGNSSNRPASQDGANTLTPNALPAPDDSTFTSLMEKDGTFKEVREFKSHPTLLRVERKLLGDRDRYTVFLKNGKSYSAPSEKMANMRALAPENILDAIGLLKPDVDNPSPTSADKKKK